MDEELKAHHYWREDRITGRLVVITPDEYEQWGKDNQPSEAYRPAFTRAQLPSQGGEAVEVVGWRRLDRPYELTAYPSVCAMWHGAGYPVQALYTHPADQVEDNLTMVKVPRELLQDLRDLAFDQVEHHRAAMGAYKQTRQSAMDSVLAQADALLRS